jgi:hypothetical protein
MVVLRTCLPLTNVLRVLAYLRQRRLEAIALCIKRLPRNDTVTGTDRFRNVNQKFWEELIRLLSLYK